MLIIKSQINKFFVIFLCVHALVWTLVPTLTNSNLPLDTIETLAWASDFQWGYIKHPPLSAWFPGLVFKIFSNKDWLYYLLSQIFVVFSFIIVWKFSEDFFQNPLYRLISILLLEGIYFYNFTTPEFNVNICQLPFWALTVFYSWQGVKQNKYSHWIFFGIFSALGILTKYIFVYLLISLVIFFIYIFLKSKKFNFKYLIVIASFFIIFFPHLLWLINNNFISFKYALDRTNLENSILFLHIFNPIQFLIKQFGILIPFFMMLLSIIPVFGTKINLKDKKFVFLLTINILPIILLILTSFITGAKIRTMWMTPFYLFIGVIFVYIFQDKIKLERLKYFFVTFLIFFILSPSIYYFSTVKPEISSDFSKLMSWADSFRKLKVRTNSETPSDTKIAREFGAEGIGLCRTEHMFFDEERIVSVRQMILSKTSEDREKALKKILPYQKNDFIEIFKIMYGLPVTVRLLDPPLHEFLPKTDKDIEDIAKELKLTHKDIKSRILELHEQNPMLGHRGCRLGISFPEIYNMQCEAIFEALVECKKQKVKLVIPEIMIPLVSTAAEIKILRKLVEKTAKEIQKKYSIKIKYYVGTMIELPRAALRAKDIAKFADFFSFGTNDLTQTTFGISRDDAGKFLNDYVENKIFNKDPFISIDERGVGELIKIAVERGKMQKKSLKLGICGEHGGDPSSVEFCAKAGLNYVSCSPYRVPVARLAAAQAYLRKKS